MDIKEYIKENIDYKKIHISKIKVNAILENDYSEDDLPIWNSPCKYYINDCRNGDKSLETLLIRYYISLYKENPIKEEISNIFTLPKQVIEIYRDFFEESTRMSLYLHVRMKDNSKEATRFISNCKLLIFCAFNKMLFNEGKIFVE